MSRAYTAEEVRELFLDQVRMLVEYWAAQPNQTDLDRCEGVAFSMLNVFDGTSSGLPAFDIVARPHHDDKRYHMANGDNYIKDGTVINDCMLHELIFKKG